MEKFHILKKTKLIFFLTVVMSLFFTPFQSFAKGKIYGQSKTLSKEHTKYEKCRLKETLLNIKDGEKDGYKCVYKRQKRGKDVTVFQPSAICQKSFKCKQENQ